MPSITSSSLVKLTSCFALLSQLALSDPVFECKDLETGEVSFKTTEEYQACGLQCECSVFEHLCLIKRRDNDFEYYTLEQRSLAFEQTCESPDCVCNSNQMVLDDSMSEAEIAFQ